METVTGRRSGAEGNNRRSDRQARGIAAGQVNLLGGGGRNRTGVDGFAGRCMTTLPPRQGRRPARRASPTNERESLVSAAGSPSWIWSGKGVSNSRPQPWQGCALPTELFPRWTALNYIVF